MNWQDNISVPMPKIYVPDKDFIGKQVVLHMCEFHEDCEPASGYTRKEVSLTGNCNCKLKGKNVTITGFKQTPRASFYRSTCYTIAESKNLIHELEFSPEKQAEISGITTGYVIEGKSKLFLTAGFNYVKKDKTEDGYVHNTGVTKSLLKSEWKPGYVPAKAYPAEFNWKTKVTMIVGKPLSWKQLSKKILVK
ncbi:hypothetical protein BMS3Abin15_00170 [bacterium BMS3Abin15]|nr:hypothetical protein BMS3Abin15_00170 [bacterium BMS3Abin15]